MIAVEKKYQQIHLTILSGIALALTGEPEVMNDDCKLNTFMCDINIYSYRFISRRVNEDKTITHVYSH